MASYRVREELSGYSPLDEPEGEGEEEDFDPFSEKWEPGMIINSSSIPNIMQDFGMPRVSPVEWKVLSYLLRKTFGFRKLSDSVSLSQFEKGITRRDGKKLDEGTGLSLTSIKDGLAGLVEKNLILKRLNKDDRGGDLPTTYRINLATDFFSNPKYAPGYRAEGGGAATRPGEAAKRPPVAATRPGGGRQTTTQNLTLQNSGSLSYNYNAIPSESPDTNKNTDTSNDTQREPHIATLPNSPNSTTPYLKEHRDTGNTKPDTLTTTRDTPLPPTPLAPQVDKVDRLGQDSDGAKPAKPRKPKAADPRNSQAVATWCEKWKEVHGVVFVVDGYAAGTVKRLLGAMSHEDWEKVVDLYMKEPYWRGIGHPLTGLGRNINQYRARVQAASAPRSVPAAQLPFKEDW